MALLDLLSSLVRAPSPDAGQAHMDDVTVPGRPRSNPPPIVQQAPQSQQLMPGMNIPSPQEPQSVSQGGRPVTYDYNNSADVGAVRAANRANAPEGGSVNSGIYGLLPQSMQHGTLRNVLGAIGDAFLVQGGAAPNYAQHMERQQLGDAMAGMNPDDPQSMQAGFQRMAATGATGAMADVDTQQKNYNDVQLRRQIQEQNNWYHQQTVANRLDMRLQSIVPTVGGVLSGVHSAADYQSAYDQIARRIQRIDPDSTPESIGLPARDGWTPGSTDGYGTTGNAQVTAATASAGQASGRRNTDVRASATVRAAQIGAGSRVDAANISANKETPILRREYLSGKADKAARGLGPPLSAYEQQEFAHDTQVSRNSRRPSPSAGGGPAAASPAPIVGHVYKDAHNNTATYKGGDPRLPTSWQTH